MADRRTRATTGAATAKVEPMSRRGRAPRRSDALSRARVVQAAVAILDAHGESALTARTLTDHLHTGRGAIYHHVSGMPDLMAGAAEQVIRAAIAEPGGGTAPAAAIRQLGLGIFDAISAHPWIGAQLAREPAQPAVLHIWTSLGRALNGLGVTGSHRLDAGSTLANYIFGAAAQHGAATARTRDPAARREYLDALAATWIQHDGTELTRESAAGLRDHDDRRQFAAGLDIVLRGIQTPTVQDTDRA